MPILRLTRTRGQFWAQTFIALLSDFSGVSEFTFCNILGRTVWCAFRKLWWPHVTIRIEVSRPEYNVWWLSQNHKWQSDITIFSKRVDPWISVSAWRLLFQLIMNKSKRHIRRRESSWRMMLMDESWNPMKLQLKILRVWPEIRHLNFTKQQFNTIQEN